MRQILAGIFLISSVLVSVGQNLIPNPGFEEYSDCPDQAGLLTNAFSWMNPNVKSPDLYDTCVGAACENPPFVCVPENWVGEQYPYAGQAYAGIFVGGGNENREYMQVPLLASLEADRYYVLTYHLSLADGSEHAIDRMGVYLSPTAVFADGQFNYTPQSSSPSGLFLQDKVRWMEIRDTIRAAGGEAFLTIGNFNDEANTSYIDGLGGGRGSAYYYFDELGLVPAEPMLPAEEDPTEEEVSDQEEKPGAEEATTEYQIDIFFPNVFSPNQDGLNDLIRPLSDAQFITYEWSVFNRWGMLVFRTQDPNLAWDGTIRGNAAPGGVYLHALTYSVSSGKKINEFGSFTLLR